MSGSVRVTQGLDAGSTAVYLHDYKDLQQEYFDGTIAFPRNAASAWRTPFRRGPMA